MANANAPTAPQLNYLRQLARRTGSTFTAPRTKRAASAEIHRLRSITSTGFTFAELASENEARELHGDPPVTYATAVRDDEVIGYGANARWSH